MIKYELLDVTYGQVVVRHNEDGTDTFIPMNENNADYQAYLNKDNPDWGKGTIS